MPTGLRRYQQGGDLHFVTFSCFGRDAYLNTADARAAFEHSLETMRRRYRFVILGYVVMPEHVHLLLSEPAIGSLAGAVHAIKLSVSKKAAQRPFWLARYYDFNVFTRKKQIEKLKYMHRNPVNRGLVTQPGEWQLSSYGHYSTGAKEIVSINEIVPLAHCPP